MSLPSCCCTAASTLACRTSYRACGRLVVWVTVSTLSSWPWLPVRAWSSTLTRPTYHVDLGRAAALVDGAEQQQEQDGEQDGEEQGRPVPDEAAEHGAGQTPEALPVN